MIQIENMTFAYAKSKENIHTNISLSLTENKIYGLLGKNGTGKSTLLYLIAGLLKPTDGRVTADGISTTERRQATLEDMFIINEEFTLPQIKLSEWSQSLSRFYPKYDEETFQNSLDEFEIKGNPVLTSLSMGQQKKVIISFALATNVKHLLMDEPTNGLDIPSKAQFRKVVSRAMNEDRVIIISTHQVHDVELLLDHIIIIDRDRMILNASNEEITNRYTFEYRIPGSPVNDVIYQEPSLQGNATIAFRNPSNDKDTNINIELLFNAAINGKI
ncbi:MAG: ABC transporter ATP-binding protein [Prevotella sp.]|nr:ABC transporter ATP-binding protein [Prevotella sp.]